MAPWFEEIGHVVQTDRLPESQTQLAPERTK
jgi:hypothetical protein